MTAIFRIIQSAAPGEWGIARQDLTLVGVGGTITLEAETQVSPLETYIWEVISQPEGSVADTTLTVPNPATAPWIATVDLDVTGGYAIRLIYQPGTPAEDITILYLGVALDNSGLCVPAFNETIFDNSYAAGGSGDTYVGYERKLTAFLKAKNERGGGGGFVHALGGAAHLADTLANLNTKISDATLFGQELFDANTMLVATIDNTPAPLVIAVSSFVGRKSTGDISAMTPAEARTVLNVAAGADVTADNPPQAHHVSHENGGSDEISVAGLSGVLAEAQNPTAHALGGAAHSADTLANLNTKISDADLSDVASGITNDSAVSGTNVDDALDNLDTTITSIISGYSRRKKVINIVDGTLAPPTEVTGDRYIPDDTGALHADWDGASAWDIVEFDSANWVATTPIEGWVTYIDTLNQDALFVDDGAPAWELRDVYTSLHADLSDIGVDDHHDMVHDHTDDLSGGLLILNSFYDNDSGIRSIIVDDGDMSIDLRTGNSFIVDVSDASVSGMSDGFKVNGYGSTYFKVAPIITEVYPAPLAISSVVAQMDITVGGAFSIAGGTDSSMSVTGGALSLSTITTGELDLTSAGLLDINAGANLDIDVTGNCTLDATGIISIDAAATIAWSGTNASLTSAGALAIASDFTLGGDLYTDRWLNSVTNTFVGVSAGGLNNLSHTTGNEGYGNTAFGGEALEAITTGDDNTAVGFQAMKNNTTGVDNVALGQNSLKLNTTGSWLTALGEGTLESNVDGYDNMAVGQWALRSNVSGHACVAVGREALENSTSSFNVAIGHRALEDVTTAAGLVAIGADAGNGLLSGNQNTFIGYNTGVGITTGAFNTIIGASVTGLSAALSNTIILADGQGNQRLYINSTGVTAITDGGLSTGWISNSLSMGHDSSGHTSWIQSGAVAATTLFLNPQGGLTVIGGTGVGSRGMGSGDCYFSGGIEIDNASYFDGALSIAGTTTLTGDLITAANKHWRHATSVGSLVLAHSGQTNECMVVFTGSGNNTLLMASYADNATNFGAPIYIDPTLRLQSSDATNILQYVATQHNQADAKEIIGTGSKVTEHITPLSVADDNSLNLPDATSGRGWFQWGDSKELVIISWDSAGVADVTGSSANVVETDLDGNICVLKVGTQIQIKNRLNAAKEVMFEYNYWTP